MSIKVIGGAMAGVFVPIAIEYAMNGADVNATIPYKWSGIAGIVMGAVPLGLVMAKIGPFERMSDTTKDAVIAFGAASLATGVAILLLEQLRKSTAAAVAPNKPYIFQPMQPAMVPMQQGLYAQQYTAPVGQVIKEI